MNAIEKLIKAMEDGPINRIDLIAFAKRLALQEYSIHKKANEKNLIVSGPFELNKNIWVCWLSTREEFILNIPHGDKKRYFNGNTCEEVEDRVREYFNKEYI